MACIDFIFCIMWFILIAVEINLDNIINVLILKYCTYYLLQKKKLLMIKVLAHNNNNCF